jgi:Zn-dependent peptidase ImmA (M78 family)
MPSIVDINFKPIQLAKFKKANDEVVSSKLIENLEMIALLFREQEAINNSSKQFTHEYFRLSDSELIAQVYDDLNYDKVRTSLQNASELEAKYIFDDLIKNIYDTYGLKIFLIDANKSPFNFDGIYFDKTVATAYIASYPKAYSKTLFTMLHEMYHFFKDNGTSNTFDIFNDGSEGQTHAEDIRANKFAINFLLYNSKEDLLSFKNNPNLDSLIVILKKYGVSRQALGIELSLDLSSYRTGNIHSCYFNFAKKEINDLLNDLTVEGSISSRKYNELIGAITK